MVHLSVLIKSRNGFVVLITVRYWIFRNTGDMSNAVRWALIMIKPTAKQMSTTFVDTLNDLHKAIAIN